MEMSDSDGFEAATDDEKGQIPPEIQAARNEWNEIERQQKELEQLPSHVGVGGVTVDRGHFITFYDSRAYLIDQCEKISCDVPPLVEDPPRCFCFRRRNNPTVVDSWEKIFKISRISFDENDLTHHRILNSLNSLITGVRTAPLRKGPHWKTIGFQSEDPITDLRATGMMGLLLPMQLFAKFDDLSARLVKTSRLKEQEFPMMVVLISFVGATLEAAGTSPMLKGADSLFGCWDQMGRFFAGMVDELCEVWNNELCDLEHDFRRFDQISNRAKNRPLMAIERGKAAEAKNKIVTGQLMSDEGKMYV